MNTTASITSDGGPTDGQIEQLKRFLGDASNHTLQLLSRKLDPDKEAVDRLLSSMPLLTDAMVDGVLQAAVLPVKRRLVPWRTIDNGGIEIFALLSELLADGAEVSGIDIRAFPPDSKERKRVKLVVLKQEQLGFGSQNVRIATYMNEAFCKEWSEKHLNQQAISLCEAEDGLQLRRQLGDEQPQGEMFHLAMIPILDFDGKPVMFRLARSKKGCCSLHTNYVHRDAELNGGNKIIFRLIEASSSPTAEIKERMFVLNKRFVEERRRRDAAEKEGCRIAAQIKEVQQDCPHTETHEVDVQDGAGLKPCKQCSICGARL